MPWPGSQNICPAAADSAAGEDPRRLSEGLPRGDGSARPELAKTHALRPIPVPSAARGGEEDRKGAGTDTGGRAQPALKRALSRGGPRHTFSPAASDARRPSLSPAPPVVPLRRCMCAWAHAVSARGGAAPRNQSPLPRRTDRRPRWTPAEVRGAPQEQQAGVDGADDAPPCGRVPKAANPQSAARWVASAGNRGYKGSARAGREAPSAAHTGSLELRAP
eukprot:scaffold2421_cov390-Prasinococcus_capsulatus_cf.AAC.10